MQQSAIKANRAAWLAALRSGEYQQARGVLRHDGRDCVIGVACAVMEKRDAKRYAVAGANQDDRAYKMVAAAMGLSEADQDALCDMNDNWKFDFEQIAAAIEQSGMFPIRKGKA